MLDSKPLIFRSETDFPALKRGAIEILQVNLGYLCNLSCTHCHVNAGPTRKEMMDEKTVDTLIDVLRELRPHTLDLTGGAPEMNPHFKRLVLEAKALGVHVIDRCNLTILLEPGYEDMAEFLAKNQIQVVASLPCYLEENVDSQRGKGVYQSSIDAITRLNSLGYSKPGSGLTLDLVYNPTGPYLPPAQEALEQDYKRELKQRFNIEFNSLLTITNMPISRFGAVLMAHNQFDDYMQLLRDNYSKDNLSSVMCRTTVSVDYLGRLYDCDFNQMLEMPISHTETQWHLKDLLNTSVESWPILVADHCYGCTAGQGSSCGGALD